MSNMQIDQTQCSVGSMVQPEAGPTVTTTPDRLHQQAPLLVAPGAQVVKLIPGGVAPADQSRLVKLVVSSEQQHQTGATQTTYTISDCVSQMSSAAVPTAVYQNSTPVAAMPRSNDGGAAPPTPQTESTVVPQRLLTIVPGGQKGGLNSVQKLTSQPHNNVGISTPQRLQMTNPRLITTTSMSATQKYQLLNNVILNKSMARPQPATAAAKPTAAKHTNLTAVPNQHRPLANPTQKLVKPAAAAINRPTLQQLPKTIKTIPPQAQLGYLTKPSGIKTIPAQVNHYNKMANSAKMVAGQMQRVGLKTLPPQRAVVNNRANVVAKPNYIGKHAVQAQKNQQKVASSGKRTVHVQPRANNLVKYQPKPGNSSIGFNQALTSQFLQNFPAPVNRSEASYTSPKNYQMPPNEDSISLADDIGEEVEPAISPNLSYVLQIVMLDHNYVASPPLEPLPQAQRSPSPPHTPVQQQQAGAQATQNGASVGQSAQPKTPFHSSSNTSLGYNRASATMEQGSYRGAEAIPDDRSDTSSIDGRDGDEGEETETAPEGEDDTNSVTTCICDYIHDDGWMIQCDICSSWQHVKCMFPSIPPSQKDKLPEKYFCVRCEPRPVDSQLARANQSHFAQTGKHEQTPPARHGAATVTVNNAANSASTLSVPVKQSGHMSDSSDTSTADSIGEVAQPRRKQTVSLNNNLITKKRGHPGSLSARRRSEPSSQSRRAPLPSKRRRESARDTSQTAAAPRRLTIKKREKKQVMKRKVKSRASLDEDSQDSWPAPSTYNAPTLAAGLLQLRQWIENYEEAVTNHYSPELRARISNMRANGTNTSVNDKQAPPNAHLEVAVHKCKVITHHLTGVKMVLATQTLSPNTAVIELMGKYMLSTQHRTAGGAPGVAGGGAAGAVSAGTGGGALMTRQHSQRPGPFLFFYRLPRDGTEVCVDTRTYGNNARFIRRSCRPNAELRHCVEKGTLHLYIIAIVNVEKNSELTIKHESHDLAAAAAALTTGGVSVSTPIPCACGNVQQCGLYTNHRKNGGSSPDITSAAHSLTSKKRRGRRASSPSRAESAPAPPTQLNLHSPGAGTTSGPPALSTRRASQQSRVNSASGTQSRDVDKEDYKPEKNNDIKDKKKKLTREERKMEAIVKAFEKMERAEIRKQEVRAKQAQRRESESGTTNPQARNLENGDMELDGVRTRRKKRKGRIRTTSTTSVNSGRRRPRLNSTDSYITSCDDSSLLSPPLPTSATAESNIAPDRHTSESTDVKPGPEEPEMSDQLLAESSHSEMNSPGQVNTAAGLLLALANGGGSSNNDQSLTKESPEMDGNSSGSSSSAHSLPDTPLSSACLLVAAAVGPLEPDFKFPKTKKAIMNEWLKSPEPIQSASMMSPISLQPTTIEQSDMLLQQSQHIATEYYNTSMSTSNKSLATLVQAASSLCESPPQSSRAPLVPAGTPPVQGQGVGNAKKRWLRQAISEECDSPCSRPESPPGCPEMVVAPPKKRRLARESLSSEQSFTPPNTPTMLVPPTNSLVEEEYPNNDEEFYTSEERNTSNESPSGVEYTKIEGTESSRGLLLEPTEPATMSERSAEIRLEFSPSIAAGKEEVDIISRKYTDTLSTSLLDPRLGRDRPIFRDSAQLLGTVEKTIRFYEENLTGTVSPVVTPAPEEPKEKPQPKPEMVTPAKRKLSISEYRQRKQLTTPTGERPPSPESPAPQAAATQPAPITGRSRSGSTSSTTSSLSSDDESGPVVADTKIATTVEPQVAVAFNSAPTTVERQRENVERIKKAFGLARDDDTKKTVRESLPSPILSITSPQIDPKVPNVVPKLDPVPPVHRYREDPRKYDRSELTLDHDHNASAAADSHHGSDEDRRDAKLNTKLKTSIFDSSFVSKKPETTNLEGQYYGTKCLYKELSMTTCQLNDSEEKDKRVPKEKNKRFVENLKESLRSTIFSEPSVKARHSSRLSPEPYYSTTTETEHFGVSDSTHFIPPFNNPVYPNSTQFTGFSSVMDTTSPYEGRNPSPPPSTYQNTSS